jgi:hypothetical protein
MMPQNISEYVAPTHELFYQLMSIIEKKHSTGLTDEDRINCMICIATLERRKCFIPDNFNGMQFIQMVQK